MRILVSLVCIGVLLALMRAAAEVVTPFLLGSTLAIAFQPIAAALDRRGLPPVAAALLMILVVLAVAAAAGLVMYLAAVDLASQLPEYRRHIAETQLDLSMWLDQRRMHSAARSVRDFDLGGPAGGYLQTGIFQIGAFLQGMVLVVVITAFMQVEAGLYRKKMLRAFGSARPVHWVIGALREVQRYLLVKLAFSLFNGVMLGLWCWIWGVDSPLMWGVLAFLLNFIPFIGSLLAAIPPLMLAWVTGGVGTALGVAAGYIAVNLFVDNVFEPRIMGRTLGLSPLVLLLSMLVWGFVLGLVGALLAVPLTMTIKLLLDRHPDLKPIALFMSDGAELLIKPAPSPQAAS